MPKQGQPMRVLLTGFGPFPGAPVNPTGAVIRRIARQRIADARITTHIFETSYAVVDSDLPKLIAREKPDVLLMFGLATRARTIRIEMRARNARGAHPDVTGKIVRGAIVRGDDHQMMRLPFARMLTCAKAARVPVTLSRDAGRYLCNYLCWRASEASAKKNGPKYAAFVHIPLLPNKAFRSTPSGRSLTVSDVARLGTGILRVLMASARVK